jgi:hypothetical protein
VFFQVVGGISHIETIAVGRRIRALSRLKKLYGEGRWRKMKGEATVRLADGQLRHAELHWYEAHGMGRHGLKVKRLLD